MDLPRASHDLPVEQYFVYYRPLEPVDVTAVEPVDVTAVGATSITTTKEVITSRAVAMKGEEIEVIDDDFSLAAARSRAGAIDALAEFLHDKGYVVDRSESVDTRLFVVAMVRVRKVWPLVAGVTGPDWELLGEPLPYGGARPRFIGRLWDAQRRAELDDQRQIVWAVHPKFTESSALCEYFTIVHDERVPIGKIRMARMVR